MIDKKQYKYDRQKTIFFHYLNLFYFNVSHDITITKFISDKLNINHPHNQRNSIRDIKDYFIKYCNFHNHHNIID